VLIQGEGVLIQRGETLIKKKIIEIEVSETKMNKFPCFIREKK